MPINLPTLEERTRSFAFKPETADENTRSVRAVIATDNPVVSTEARSGKGVLEVWRMDGLEPFEKTPLMDAHSDKSIRSVLGSVTDPQVQGSEATARVQISEAEPNVWTKVREGHISDVSGRCQPLEMESVQRGTTRAIRGQQYNAPRDRDLNVITKWRMREVSLVPFGADPRAKIRSDERTFSMNETTRKYLETIGLKKDATAEEAKAFYDSLPESTRGLADAAKAEPPAATATVTVRSEPKNDPPTKDEATVRRETLETERKRVKEIERLGAGLPADTIRAAIDEGIEPQTAAVRFLEAMRGGRTQAVAAPAIHSRSHEKDCTAEILGLAFSMRSLSGDQLLKHRGRYAASGHEGKDDHAPAGMGYRLRRFAGDDQTKADRERLMEQADRYAGLSLHDVCREACRLDGHAVPIHMDSEETFRTAVSGSALAQIFTTNVNAQLLQGYTDFTDSTTGWCSESDVNNFLTNERDMMGKFGNLKRVVKGRPAEHLDTSDWKESYKISRYGGQFVVDEQDIINDRFGAIEQVSPLDMGLASAQLRPNLVYYIVLANAALDVDGGTLFNTTAVTTAGGHANKGTGTALSATQLQVILAAMGKVRMNGRPLNIRGRYVIVPQDLKFVADITVLSQERIIAAASGGTYNPLKDLGLTIRFDDRMGVAGVTDPITGTAQAGTATNFLVTAQPGEEGAKTIEVGYRRGTGRAPMVRSFVLDKGQWGVGWDINMDIGAKALDWRAMYFDPGA